MSLPELQSFIIQQQQEPQMAEDERSLSSFMRDFVQDPRRNVDPPYFTIKEVTINSFYLFLIVKIISWIFRYSSWAFYFPTIMKYGIRSTITSIRTWRNLWATIGSHRHTTRNAHWPLKGFIRLTEFFYFIGTWLVTSFLVNLASKHMPAVWIKAVGVLNLIAGTGLTECRSYITATHWLPKFGLWTSLKT